MIRGAEKHPNQPAATKMFCRRNQTYVCPCHPTWSRTEDKIDNYPHTNSSRPAIASDEKYPPLAQDGQAMRYVP